MKKLLSTAAIALLSTTGIADADTISIGTVGTILPIPTGAVYTDISKVAGNVETATPTVTNTWTIKGNVTPDCSYFGGNGSKTLDFGQIGVNTQSNTTADEAFSMRGGARASVTSTTAGCNFNNEVKISKGNGTQGLVNKAAKGYDTNEFQANIPYTVTASFTGTTDQAAGAAGKAQKLVVDANKGTNSWVGGAWRSSLNMLIEANSPDKALVAGDYSDTLEVVLAAK